ncbi:C-reactive protein-like [Eriocheir sinensis]|uniref:C-reactive protein-like n=1 Tax=Eriocheir sinensis TaxID=95602 RepID=UPI0021C91E48|nr:C-reactive protein-like [Eriocheir sinensis]
MVKFVAFAENNIHFSYSVFNDNMDYISVGHREDVFFLWSFGGVAEGRLPGVVVPEVWYHACHVFEKRGYVVYWQGEEVYTGSPQASWPLLLNGTVVLGQEQDQVGGGFDATQVRGRQPRIRRVWGHQDGDIRG